MKKIKKVIALLLASATETEKKDHAALDLPDMINAMKVYGSEYYDVNISSAFLHEARSCSFT